MKQLDGTALVVIAIVKFDGDRILAVQNLCTPFVRRVCRIGDIGFQDAIFRFHFDQNRLARRNVISADSFLPTIPDGDSAYSQILHWIAVEQNLKSLYRRKTLIDDCVTLDRIQRDFVLQASSIKDVCQKNAQNRYG